jgi:hypothetical protein
MVLDFSCCDDFATCCVVAKAPLVRDPQKHERFQYRSFVDKSFLQQPTGRRKTLLGFSHFPQAEAPPASGQDGGDKK